MIPQDFVTRARTGRIFSVQFIKRSNGTLRKMVCRTNVTKGTKGGSMGYRPEDHNLLSVYDMQAKGFRVIPIDAIVDLKIDGVRYAMEA